MPAHPPPPQLPAPLAHPIPFWRPALAALLALLCGLLLGNPARALTLDTVAGTGGGDGPDARQALLQRPAGLAVDKTGNLYIAETEGHRVRRIDAVSGAISTVAGNGIRGLGGDGGPASEALLAAPQGLAVDADGNLLIADTGNSRIRRVHATSGRIETLIAPNPSDLDQDGIPMAHSLLRSPSAVALTRRGDVLITDTGSHRVLKLHRGRLSSLAGTGQPGYAGDDGPAGDAALGYPSSIVVGRDGSLYVADEGNRRIRRIDAITGWISSLAVADMDNPRHFPNVSGLALEASGRKLFIADGVGRVWSMPLTGGSPRPVAGNGAQDSYGDGGPALEAALRRPQALAVDGSGGLLIADREAERVRRVNLASGGITAVAGVTPDLLHGEFGPAAEAQLYFPRGVARDRHGNVYVADTQHHQIRRIEAATGDIVPVAGSGARGDWGEGEAAPKAALNAPVAVAVGTDDSVYIADLQNHRILKVGSDGILRRLAGTGEAGSDGDGGPAVEARLSHPRALAVDAAGNVYVSDSLTHQIRRIDASGRIDTLAGDGQPGFGGDGGPARAARLSHPAGLALQGDMLLVADAHNHRVRRIDLSSGRIDTFAGTGQPGMAGDGGTALAAQLHFPFGVDAGADGTVYIADSSNHRVRRIDQDLRIHTVAGTSGGFAGDGGGATQAALRFPMAVTSAPDGTLFIADMANHRLRRVDASGHIATLAGTGGPEFNGDGGPLASAELARPNRVALGDQDQLFILDGYGVPRVRRLDLRAGRIDLAAGGTGSDIAGNGPMRPAEFDGDGEPAQGALFRELADLAVDPAGNLYLADPHARQVRRVEAGSGVVSTVAGSGAEEAGGDGGPAIAAGIALPSGLALDPAGNLYIADTRAHQIRRVDARSGLISTLAGDGVAGDGGDGGPARAARLRSPTGLAVDARNQLYVADTFNHRVRRVDLTTGQIDTVAGTGSSGSAGAGGPARASQLSYPASIAPTHDGGLLIIDNAGLRLSKVGADGVMRTLTGGNASAYTPDGANAEGALHGSMTGVVEDAQGRIYFTDPYNRRVRVLLPTALP